MSSFFNNFIGGMAFGMLANNPFFSGCYGFGMYPMSCMNFGGFANPFPSIFGSGFYASSSAAMLPPTTFANSTFPSVNFNEVGQIIWDTYANPDSEYNKQIRNYYEQINKQYEESKKDSDSNRNYQSQMPFFQTPMMVNPWQFMTIPGMTKNNKTSEVKSEEKSSKDAKDLSADKDLTAENNNSVISYDAKQLKDKWSKKQPQLTEEFYDKVVKISKNVKCSPDDLMALMNLETAKTFSPSKKCGLSSAIGLIQFTSDTAKTLGTSTDELKKMTAVEQLDYVEKYLLYWKKDCGYKDSETLSAGVLYALVFQPGNVKKEVLASAGTKEYTKNKSLDANKDGKITKEDLAKKLNEFMA